MAPDESELTPEQEERALIAIQRMRSHFLGLPALCVKAVCRKARKCSADPDICMEHMGSDVPEDVRRAVDALINGKIQGLSFDEVFAEAPHELAAYCEWLGKVTDSRAQPDAMRRSQARKIPAMRKFVGEIAEIHVDAVYGAREHHRRHRAVRFWHCQIAIEIAVRASVDLDGLARHVACSCGVERVSQTTSYRSPA